MRLQGIHRTKTGIYMVDTHVYIGDALYIQGVCTNKLTNNFENVINNIIFMLIRRLQHIHQGSLPVLYRHIVYLSIVSYMLNFICQE